jgi:hypothetical protein
MLKRILFPVCLLFFSLLPTSCETIQSLGLTDTEIVSALREALSQGSDSASSQLSALNGYYGNPDLKILLPKEAAPILQYASALGLQSQIDDLVLKMNRGAEMAAKKAAPIFVNAITTMTVTDGLSILKGTDSAATAYLRTKTYSQLTSAFAPEINSAMDEVGAATLWNTVFSTYNNYAQLVGLSPVNSNLGEYATGKALNGLFVKVADHEKVIRNDVTKRTTELLRKVFAEQD